MKFHEESLEIKSRKRLEVVDITEDVQQALRKSG